MTACCMSDEKCWRGEKREGKGEERREEGRGRREGVRSDKIRLDDCKPVGGMEGVTAYTSVIHITSHHTIKYCTYLLQVLHCLIHILRTHHCSGRKTQNEVPAM